MSSELRVDKIIPTAGVPTGGAGGVIQVVHTLASNFSTTSTSFVDVTGCTVTITPKFATSKMIIMFSAYCYTTLASSHNQRIHFKMQRDGINISNTYAVAAESGGGGLQAKSSGAMTIFDSPNTTSAVTYKMRAYNSGNWSTNGMYSPSLIAMEVSA